MEIAEKIKNARQKKGLSQRKLGNLTGISLGAIQGYEQGRYKPKYAQAKKLSDALDIPLNDLIGSIVWEVNKDKVELFTGKGNLKEIEDEILPPSLKHSFRDLNAEGREKLIAYAEDLSKIPEYRVQSTVKETLSSSVLAAHARTDVEQTPEGVQHDIDIMNDDSLWE